jgi:hypothetical protein
MSVRGECEAWLALPASVSSGVGMNDRDTEAIRRLQRRYSATATPTPKGIQLQFPGITESFELSTAHDEFTLFTSSWHEHFGTMDDLEGFLDGLFSGSVEIEVTYRGKSPVSHKVRVHREGSMQVVSSTGCLVPLFWRCYASDEIGKTGGR